MKFRPPRLNAAALTVVLLIAACSRGDQGTEGERKTAAGDVLGGSISDAMLPLDTVTSQSPPLREEPVNDAKKSTDQRKGNAEPTPEPSAEETPAAAPSVSPGAAD